MSNRDRNFWIEQAKDQLLANEKRADSAVVELMFLYDEAANQVEREIYAMFAKFATDNKLTDAEASRLLSGKEYSVWRKSIQEYIKEASGAAEDSRILLELNTLAMKSRISRKEHLLANIYQNMMDLAQDTTTKMTDLLGDIVKVSYYENCWRIQRGFGYGFTVAKINESLIKRILEYPWSEKYFSEAVWGRCDHLAALAKWEISVGFIQGSSVQKMAKAINDVIDSGRYAAERLVRTECKYFANQGQILAFKENGIAKYRFVGGSEGSTSACGCAALNGRVFSVENAQPGINLPPLHPNCICTIVAHFDKSIFNTTENTTPLEKNTKFQVWKEKYVDSQSQSDKISLSNDEEWALNSYISSESYKINDKLRRGAALTEQDRRLIVNLDRALDKMPEKQGMLYRSVSSFGIDDVDAYVKSHVIGIPKRFEAYTSASLMVYDASMDIQYVIESKHGKDITKWNPGEKEILFKRDTWFIPTRIEGNTIYMKEVYDE